MQGMSKDADENYTKQCSRVNLIKSERISNEKQHFAHQIDDKLTGNTATRRFRPKQPYGKAELLKSKEHAKMQEVRKRGTK